MFEIVATALQRIVSLLMVREQQKEEQQLAQRQAERRAFLCQLRKLQAKHCTSPLSWRPDHGSKEERLFDELTQEGFLCHDMLGYVLAERVTRWPFGSPLRSF